MPQEEPVVIALDELQSVLERILEHIKVTRGVSCITLDANYYWNMRYENTFNMSKSIDVSDINVGSLYDDWETVRRFVLIENQPLSVNLAMISALLRYVGETIADLTSAEGG